MKVLPRMYMSIEVLAAFLGVPAPDAKIAWQTSDVIPANYDTFEKKYLLAAQAAVALYEQTYQNYINLEALKEFECSINVHFYFDLLPEVDEYFCGHRCDIDLHVNDYPENADGLKDVGTQFNTVKDLVDHAVQEVISSQSWMNVGKRGIVDGNSVVITTCFF